MSRKAHFRNIKRHAQQRALERHGVLFGDEAQSSAVASIQSGEAAFLWRVSNNLSVFRIDHRGAEMPVMYDRRRELIRTVLPADAVELSWA